MAIVFMIVYPLEDVTWQNHLTDNCLGDPPDSDLNNAGHYPVGSLDHEVFVTQMDHLYI